MSRRFVRCFDSSFVTWSIDGDGGSSFFLLLLCTGDVSDVSASSHISRSFNLSLIRPPFSPLYLFILNIFFLVWICLHRPIDVNEELPPARVEFLSHWIHFDWIEGLIRFADWLLFALLMRLWAVQTNSNWLQSISDSISIDSSVWIIPWPRPSAPYHT